MHLLTELNYSAHGGPNSGRGLEFIPVCVRVHPNSTTVKAAELADPTEDCNGYF